MALSKFKNPVSKFENPFKQLIQFLKMRFKLRKILKNPQKFKARDRPLQILPRTSLRISKDF